MRVFEEFMKQSQLDTLSAYKSISLLPMNFNKYRELSTNKDSTMEFLLKAGLEIISLVEAYKEALLEDCKTTYGIKHLFSKEVDDTLDTIIYKGLPGGPQLDKFSGDNSIEPRKISPNHGKELGDYNYFNKPISSLDKNKLILLMNKYENQEDKIDTIFKIFFANKHINNKKYINIILAFTTTILNKMEDNSHLPIMMHYIRYLYNTHMLLMRDINLNPNLHVLITQSFQKYKKLLDDINNDMKKYYPTNLCEALSLIREMLGLTHFNPGIIETLPVAIKKPEILAKSIEQHKKN
jgi:hypothetical protein